MRNLVFRVGFSVVAFSTLASLSLWLISLAGKGIPNWVWVWYAPIDMFSRPLPPLLRSFMPNALNIALFFCLIFLVLRRIWLSAVSRSFAAPSSFSRAAYVLVVISVISIGLSIAVLTLSMLFRAGSGVPAGMLLLPAGLLLPIGITWTEAMSVYSAFRAKP